jgi:hypothetical protein
MEIGKVTIKIHESDEVFYSCSRLQAPVKKPSAETGPEAEA